MTTTRNAPSPPSVISPHTSNTNIFMSDNGANASTSGQATPDIITIDAALYPPTIIELVEIRPPTTVEEVEDGEETYVDAEGSTEGNDSDQENVPPLPIPPRPFTGVLSITA